MQVRKEWRKQEGNDSSSFCLSLMKFQLNWDRLEVDFLKLVKTPVDRSTQSLWMNGDECARRTRAMASLLRALDSAPSNNIYHVAILAMLKCNLIYHVKRRYNE